MIQKRRNSGKIHQKHGSISGAIKDRETHKNKHKTIKFTCAIGSQCQWSE